MNKKITMVALISAAALLSSTAFAAYPDVPEPVAPKKDSGFYVSGQLGWGWLRASRRYDDLFDDYHRDDNGLAGRLALGYNFNKYFGLELGAARWSDIVTKYSINPAYVFNTPNYNSARSRPYAVDLLGKASLPFDNGFRVFVKGGAAAIIEQYSDRIWLYDSTGTFLVGSGKGSGWDTSFDPEAVVGIGYDFNEHWSAELAYSRVFGYDLSSHHRTHNSDLDMATVGLTYNFG